MLKTCKIDHWLHNHRAKPWSNFVVGVPWTRMEMLALDQFSAPKLCSVTKTKITGKQYFPFNSKVSLPSQYLQHFSFWFKIEIPKKFI